MSGGRRAPLVVLVAVAVVLVAVLVLRLADGGGDHIDRAEEIAADDDAFETTTGAGEAFVRISVALQEGGEACAEDADRSERCDHLFSAAAYARVSAVSVLTCTRRGTIEARSAMRSFLAALDRDADAKVPSTPSCASR